MRNGKKPCFTRKLKYFNKAWADIAAAELKEKHQENFKPYRCGCGWWHVANRTKKRRKENAKESRNRRRKRRKIERQAQMP